MSFYSCLVLRPFCSYSFSYYISRVGSDLRKSKGINNALPYLIMRIFWLSACLLGCEHFIWFLLEFWKRRFDETKFLVRCEREVEVEDNSLNSWQECSYETFYQSLHAGCVCLNPLKPKGNNMSHLLQQSVTLHFVFMGFVRFSL
jgi:hypothetical protein